MHVTGAPKESIECDGTRTSRPAKPSPNPDDAGLIVRSLMGLLVAAGCNTARDQTRVCSDISSTATQCLSPRASRGGAAALLHCWLASQLTLTKWACDEDRTACFVKCNFDYLLIQQRLWQATHHQTTTTTDSHVMTYRLKDVQ